MANNNNVTVFTQNLISGYLLSDHHEDLSRTKYANRPTFKEVHYYAPGRLERWNKLMIRIHNEQKRF